jgi:hypothetical protein
MRLPFLSLSGMSPPHLRPLSFWMHLTLCSLLLDRRTSSCLQDHLPAPPHLLLVPLAPLPVLLAPVSRMRLYVPLRRPLRLCHARLRHLRHARQRRPLHPRHVRPRRLRPPPSDLPPGSPPPEHVITKVFSRRPRSTTAPAPAPAPAPLPKGAVAVPPRRQPTLHGDSGKARFSCSRPLHRHFPVSGSEDVPRGPYGSCLTLRHAGRV